MESNEAQYLFTESELNALIADERAAEREACAKLVDENAKACTNNSMVQMVLYANATAIRARGQK